MQFLYYIIGAALLLFGRKVFWLFVAGVGFVAGMSLAASTFNGPEWLDIVIGLAVGFAAALLAVFVQKFAIGLAGFLAGGYIAMQILPLFEIQGGWILWVTFIVGGIIGAIMVGAFLDWALIILSSLAGASLIVDGISLPQIFSVLVFIFFVVMGISVQARDLKREKR